MRIARFFTPLLLGMQAVRSVSIVFDSVPPRRSRAAVEAAITSDDADEQVRLERGFRVTARRRRQADAARQREQELADGHEELRFAGFMTVSGRDDDELAASGLPERDPDLTRQMIDAREVLRRLLREGYFPAT